MIELYIHLYIVLIRMIMKDLFDSIIKYYKLNCIQFNLFK